MDKLLFVERIPVIIKGMHELLRNNGMEDTVLEIAGSFTEMKDKLKNGGFGLVIIGIPLKREERIGELLNIVKRDKKIPILVFDEDIHKLPLIQMYRSGIRGILDKSATLQEILTAIQVTGDGGIYASTPIVLRLLFNTPSRANHPFEKLTNREREIADLLLKGNNSRKIGEVLELKASTISTFKARIFAKLEVNSLIELSKIG